MPPINNLCMCLWTGVCVHVGVVRAGLKGNNVATPIKQKSRPQEHPTTAADQKSLYLDPTTARCNKGRGGEGHSSPSM